MRFPWGPKYELVFKWNIPGEQGVWGILYYKGHEIARADATGFPYGNYRGQEQIREFSRWLEERRTNG